jgi:Pyrimidine dimer DNA glycosylase
MRIWFIPFEELDTKRLLAQNHEWYTVWNSVTMRGQRWLGWEAEQYRYALYQKHIQILREMKLRGINYDDTAQCMRMDDVPQILFPVTHEMLLEDRRCLVARWCGTFKGRALTSQQAVDDYKQLIKEFDENGCQHRANNKKQCERCKQAKLIDGVWVGTAYQHNGHLK